MEVLRVLIITQKNLKLIFMEISLILEIIIFKYELYLLIIKNNKNIVGI